MEATQAVRVEFEPVNPTTRRYPRSLKQAFPVSENGRAAIELPEQRSPLVNRACWALSCALLVWLAWAALSH